MKNNIINILETGLRFKFKNNKDSQNCFNGVWVEKDTPLSLFEYLLKISNGISPQLLQLDQETGNFFYINNPEKIYYDDILNVVDDN